MFNKKIVAALQVLEETVRRRVNELELLEKENRRLVAQNKELMDRLMSRDFEQYQVYVSQAADEKKMTELGPEYDEYNAGEMIEVTQ